MESNTKILTKLQREVIPGFNLFETILFSTTTILATILFFLTLFVWSDSAEKGDNLINILMLIDMPLGILAATFLSKKNALAPLLLAIDGVLYGLANFLGGQYALGISSFLFIPAIYMVGFLWLWPRENKENNKVVETKKLNLKTGLVLATVAIVFAIVFGVVLTFLEDATNDGSLPNWVFWFKLWFDTFSATMMLVSVIVATLKFREAWYFFITSNALKVILFTTLIIYGDMASLELLVLSVAYLINSVFGLLVWNNSRVCTLTHHHHNDEEVEN